MPYHIAITYKCNLECCYCYARNLKFKDMIIKDFNKVLDWFEKQNIKKISLIGGEPTIHPKFEEIINIIKKRNFKTVLFTNGLFNSKIADKISSKVISSIFLNYNSPTFYTKGQRELLEKNISFLMEKNKNIVFSFNIESNKTSYQYVIDSCKKYNINKIRFSIAVPNIKRSNEFFDLTSLKSTIPHLLEFVKTAVKKNIKTILARPLPLCLFEKNEIEFLKKYNTLMSTCELTKAVFVINPDLSIYPCTTLHMKGPNLLTFKEKGEIVKYYENVIKKLKWNCYIFSKCKKCIYRLRKKCSGVCLSYKINKNLNINYQSPC